MVLLLFVYLVYSSFFLSIKIAPGRILLMLSESSMARSFPDGTPWADSRIRLTSEKMRHKSMIVCSMILLDRWALDMRFLLFAVGSSKVSVS
jgi:hypothetical protein